MRRAAIPAIDEAIKLWPRLDGFFSETAPEGPAASFARLGSILDMTAPTADQLPGPAS